jgi:transcriptional regulator GlxA family with amidase domain
VEKDLGADIARTVAHRLVMNQRRSGGQTQHSETPWHPLRPSANCAGICP